MHEITETDQVFSVRQEMWHGLGVVLPDYPTRAEAQALAHPWEPITEPVYRRVPVVQSDGMGGSYLVEHYEEIPHEKLRVRSDNNEPLGVTSDSLELVTNAEMYDIAEAIEGEDKGAVRFETGGSLAGGRKVWLLLRLRDPLRVKGDPNGTVIPYFGIQNSHDGKGGAFRGQATLVRPVCANTCQMADLDAEARGTEFAFSHTKNVRERIEQAKQALAGWRDALGRWQSLSEFLMEVPVTKEQATEFIELFIPQPPPHVTSERVLHNVEVGQALMRDILYGETCVGIEGTCYGLIQASVEYSNHYRRAASLESRFKRAYLNRDRITADAVALAKQVAGVAK
jgi:phage/plasmid-like protein (TIGR03299 family)